MDEVKKLANTMFALVKGTERHRYDRLRYFEFHANYHFLLRVWLTDQRLLPTVRHNRETSKSQLRAQRFGIALFKDS